MVRLEFVASGSYKVYHGVSFLCKLCVFLTRTREMYNAPLFRFVNRSEHLSKRMVEKFSMNFENSNLVLVIIYNWIAK